ncbi:hypothetical protein WCP94_001126 [Bilophila wadsworthia]
MEVEGIPGGRRLSEDRPPPLRIPLLQLQRLLTGGYPELAAGLGCLPRPRPERGAGKR